MSFLRSAVIAATAAVGLGLATPAFADLSCRKGQSFEAWLAGFKKQAEAAGVSRAAIEAGLAGVVFDPAIVRRDHGQGVFQQTFLQFSDRMVSPDRISTGGRLLQTHAATLRRIEAQYGVPGPVLVAFWGLETSFGTDMGKYKAPTAVATLAYDCRRSDMFTQELIDLLRIVDRGDLAPSEMVGDWAGELGHLMFTPTDLYTYAADGDGDGRRDVMRSIPDSLATAANFLKGLGWRKGEPWLEEVRVPEVMDWSRASPEIALGRGEWARMGVTRSDGAPLAAGGPPAQMWLPMGRLGPAFLTYPNFQAYLGWNKAMVYSTTAAYYATRLAGTPKVSRGRGEVKPLTTEQVKHLQALLVRRGFADETPDGRIGNATRAAVREAQMKLGLPADSYPTVELIAALEGAR